MSKDRRKLVLVGDDGSGKSSLLAVFSGGTFPATPMHPAWWTTIHVDVQIDDREVELCPYDTSSFEHMDRLRPMWYPESDAIIICFGLDSVDSLDNVKTKWAPEVLRFCPDVPFVLVGCKDHLRGTSQRCITREEGMAVAQKIGAKYYLECSAKSGHGVHDVFLYAGSAALDSRRKTGWLCGLSYVVV